MKAIFALLFVIFIQACLNSSDENVISIDENNILGETGCDSNYYGFAFNAKVTAYGKFSFYCDAPYYNQFDCEINEPKEGQKYTTISCWANGEIFPLLDEQNIVHLPEKTPSVSPFTIEGWDNLRKELTLPFCSKLTPTNTFAPNSQFTNACDNNGNNVIATKGSFSSNLQGKEIFLTSTDEDTIYRFEPYLFVDNKLAKAVCDIYVSNAENSSDEELKCYVNGQKSGVFFETAAELASLDSSTKGVIRLKATEPFSLQYCKSCFMKLSALLLISLFLL